MKRYMTMRYPAAWHGEMWREGAPCGNGTVGALVYGSVAREIVMLNHAQLWRNGKIQEMPEKIAENKDYQTQMTVDYVRIYQIAEKHRQNQFYSMKSCFPKQRSIGTEINKFNRTIRK